MKGFYSFIDLAKKDITGKYNFFVWGDDREVNLPKNVQNKGRFDKKDKDKVFKNSDLILIPSLWKETFGFITVEALSYGVPVMVSRDVGSKDLLNENCIILFDSLDEIENKIVSVMDNNQVIIKTIHDHCIEIKDKIYLSN